MENLTKERATIYFNFVDTMCEYTIEQKHYLDYKDIVTESKFIAKILEDHFDDVDEESARAFQAYAEMKMVQLIDKKLWPELFDADE